MNINMCSWVMSQAVFIWMKVRLLFIGNLVLFFTVVTTLMFLFVNYRFDGSVISFSLTYSLLVTTAFCDLVHFMSATEQKFVSVERIMQYFDNNQQEDISLVKNN